MPRNLENSCEKIGGIHGGVAKNAVQRFDFVSMRYGHGVVSHPLRQLLSGNCSHRKIRQESVSCDRAAA